MDAIRAEEEHASKAKEQLSGSTDGRFSTSQRPSELRLVALERAKCSVTDCNHT